MFWEGRPLLFFKKKPAGWVALGAGCISVCMLFFFDCGSETRWLYQKTAQKRGFTNSDCRNHPVLFFGGSLLEREEDGRDVESHGQFFLFRFSPTPFWRESSGEGRGRAW